MMSIVIGKTLDSLREGDFQIIGFDWKYVYVNPAAARHGRRSSEELIGLLMSDAYSGIDQTPLFEVLRRCIDDAAIDGEFEVRVGRHASRTSISASAGILELGSPHRMWRRPVPHS